VQKILLNDITAFFSLYFWFLVLNQIQHISEWVTYSHLGFKNYELFQSHFLILLIFTLANIFMVNRWEKKVVAEVQGLPGYKLFFRQVYLLNVTLGVVAVSEYFFKIQRYSVVLFLFLYLVYFLLVRFAYKSGEQKPRRVSFFLLVLFLLSSGLFEFYEDSYLQEIKAISIRLEENPRVKILESFPSIIQLCYIWIFFQKPVKELLKKKNVVIE
jgi:hypothetical protein